SPMIWLGKDSCARSPNPAATRRASPFSPPSLMASGKIFSWRRCLEFAASRRLRIPTLPGRRSSRRFKTRRARGVELSIQRLARPEDIVPAINAAKASDAAALNVLASALFYNNRTIIFDRVATLRLPAIYQWPEWAEEGGLIGYGPRT